MGSVNCESYIVLRPQQSYCLRNSIVLMLAVVGLTYMYTSISLDPVLQFLVLVLDVLSLLTACLYILEYAGVGYFGRIILKGDCIEQVHIGYVTRTEWSQISTFSIENEYSESATDLTIVGFSSRDMRVCRKLRIKGLAYIYGYSAGTQLVDEVRDWLASSLNDAVEDRISNLLVSMPKFLRSERKASSES